MKINDQAVNRLLKTLAPVYKAADTDPEQLGCKWQQDVMRRIRQMEPPQGQASFFQAVSQAAWKFAPVTAGLAIVCGVAAFNFDFVSEWQALDFMASVTDTVAYLDFLQ